MNRKSNSVIRYYEMKGSPVKAEQRYRRELEELVERIVRESGNPRDFNAREWVGRWIATPKGALGGRRPRDLLGTESGRTAVRQLLERMQSGAYS